VGVGALVFHRGRILLVERAREPLKGYWSIPGGVVEVGELLEDAVRREVLEETGLDVNPLSVFEIFERIIRDADGRTEYHYVLIDYLCRVVRGTACAADDVCRLAWVKRNDISSYQLTEGTSAVIEKAFRQREKAGRARRK
jgi:ADP-ribose pyrophosphatase YjhB (NUDIX family)